MSQPVRLTELTGISTSADEAESFWPVNVALLLLGGAVLGVAFYFLDPLEQRPFYNPWTYAIATPVALLVFSAALSTVVSRVIEKSMQLAFLLSVLVHLVLLVYAVNIVIFSRMWPDMLDSLAQERYQLKREALQAKQYYRVSVTSQTGRRPDYLSPVPTQHQPSEIAESISPALLLARSERANLVSPVPKVELSANPHILERAEAQPSLPADSEQAASLSRSDLTRQLEQPSTLEHFEASESPANPVVRPSEALPRRDMARSSTDLQLNAAPQFLSSNSVPPPLKRIESSEVGMLPQGTVGRVRTPRPPLTSMLRVPASIESMARANDAVGPSQAALAVNTPPLASSSLSDVSSRSRLDTLKNPMQFSESDLRFPAAASLVPNETPIPNRNDPQWQTPEPTAGDSSAAIARQTAGGVAGPPAPASMPLYNPDLIAGGAVTPLALSTPSMSIERQSIGQRRAQPLAGSALSQAPSWNGRPSLSGGIAGMSPRQLSEEASSGAAAATDTADLVGVSGAIERATAGLPALPSAVAVQSGSDEVGDQTSFAAALTDTPLAEPARTSRLSRNSRASELYRGAGDTAIPSSIQPGPILSNSEIRMDRVSDRMTGNEDSSPSEQISGHAGLWPALAKSHALGGAPAKAGIESLDSNPPDAAQPGENSTAVKSAMEREASQISRSSRASSLTTLDIEMPTGTGGISPLADRVGLLLPRRSSLVDDKAIADLDAQRYARPQVGGPLAAGGPAALPKPAFQQRLERLLDPKPLDSTTLEPQTELAIERGLAFLAKHQRDEGSWRLQDFDTEVLMRSDTAATGLALLAFQGAGYTHQQFRYADTVDRAIQFLRQHQTADGDLYIPQDPASDQNAKLYSHAIAALALCEAYGMTQDPELKDVAQRSLDFMVASQDPSRGGWRYQPGRGTDTSVTGWFMMALRSGQLAGLTVPEITFDRIRVFLDESQVSADQPHMYRYNPFAADTPQQRHGLQPTAVMTSVGLLMRLYFGWQRDRAEMVAGTDYLLQHLPEEGTLRNSRRDTYYWYYATQVLFHMGGDRWQRWHDELYPLLIRNQITSGEDAGSWDPLSPTPDLWARYGGRVYVTTMNLLSLEVSYRHLPLYEATGFDPLRK